MSLLRVSAAITRLASQRSFAVSPLPLSSPDDIMEKWPADKFDKHFVDYLNRPEIDGWEVRKTLSELHDFDVIPDPKVVEAALRACRRVNDYALCVEFLEAIKIKCGSEKNRRQTYGYIVKQIKPTLAELGISIPEEPELDKPKSFVSNSDLFQELKDFVKKYEENVKKYEENVKKYEENEKKYEENEKARKRLERVSSIFMYVQYGLWVFGIYKYGVLMAAEKVKAEKAAIAEKELVRIHAKMEAMEKSLTAEKPTKDDKDGTKDTKEKDGTFESHQPVVRDAKRADEIKKHGPVDQERKDYKTLRYNIPSSDFDKSLGLPNLEEKEKQEAGK